MRDWIFLSWFSWQDDDRSSEDTRIYLSSIQKKDNMRQILFDGMEPGLLVIQDTDPICTEIHFVGIIAADNDQFAGSVGMD